MAVKSNSKTDYHSRRSETRQRKHRDSSHPGKTTIIYLIRHAQTTANAARVIQSRAVQGELSEIGKAQAKKLQSWVESKEISFVYFSPLARARNTAEIAFQKHKRAAHHGIIEQHLGEMSGKTFDEAVEILAGVGIKLNVADTLGKGNRKRKRFFCQYGGLVGGESCEQAYERGIEALREIAGRHPGETVALVSHGYFNKILLCGLLGLPFVHESFAKVKQANACINKIVIDGEKITVETMNEAPVHKK